MSHIQPITRNEAMRKVASVKLLEEYVDYLENLEPDGAGQIVASALDTIEDIIKRLHEAAKAVRKDITTDIVGDTVYFWAAIKASRASKRVTYTLTIGSDIHPGLTKTAFMLEVVREALKRGATPEAIKDTIKVSSMWESIEGQHQTQKQFVNTSNKERKQNGKKVFDDKRFYTNNKDLFIVGERTYALSKQWGDGTDEHVGKIISLIKADDITFTKT